jgi:hypothetical protein
MIEDRLIARDYLTIASNCTNKTSINPQKVSKKELSATQFKQSLAHFVRLANLSVLTL